MYLLYVFIDFHAKKMAKYQIPNSNCLFGWNMKELTDMKLAEYMDQYNENAIWLVEIVEKSRNEITKHR